MSYDDWKLASPPEHPHANAIADLRAMVDRAVREACDEVNADSSYREHWQPFDIKIEYDERDNSWSIQVDRLLDVSLISELASLGLIAYKIDGKLRKWDAEKLLDELREEV